jgi:hypothetical protein
LEFDLGEVIAEREVLFTPDEGEPHLMIVRLGRPRPDPRAPERTWYCPYQILGINHDRVLAIFDIDAMQALILALPTVPAELAAHLRTHPGKLTRFGTPDTTWLGACRTALEYAGDVLPVVDTRRMEAQHVVDVRQPAPFLRRVMRES